MAARTGIPNKRQQDQTRAAIKTSQLVNRLQGFALGENETHAKKGEEPKPIEIDSNRLRAIEILLRKSLPDLQSIALETGEGGLKIVLDGATSKL